MNFFMPKLKLGTRFSKLALTQSQWVRQQLLSQFADLEIELVKIATTGDKIQDRFLSTVGGKGLFIKEIEEALLKGEVDFAVHSMKDVPMQLAQGLCIAAVPPRESPRDVLILRDVPEKVLALPLRVGTSALRRRVQLQRLYPHFQWILLRGNVDTRLRKLAEGEIDGIVLAQAGLKRLGERPKHCLELPIIASPGQGALALECRAADAITLQYLKVMDDPIASLECQVERTIMSALQGDCQLPMGAHAVCQGDRVRLDAFVALPDGSQWVSAKKEGTQKDAIRLGEALAHDILSRGGKEVIAKLKTNL